MNYRSDKLMIDGHTDTHTHIHTQATTIPEGQNWPRVKNWNPIKTIQVIVRTPSTHERSSRFIKKSVKNREKYKYWNSAKSGTYIMCQHNIRPLWLSSLKSLAWKLTSGMPKMSKSDDQPLCGAHIQSHPRCSPKWYIYQIKLKSDEKNSSYHPDTDGGRTDGRTDWRTDGRTGWIQYTPLRCRRRLQRRPLVSDPDMHHGTCVTC